MVGERVNTFFVQLNGPRYPLIEPGPPRREVCPYCAQESLTWAHPLVRCVTCPWIGTERPLHAERPF